MQTDLPSTRSYSISRLVTATLLAAPLSAQLSITASTTAAGFAVTDSGPSQSIAIGIDVSTGFSLHTVHPAWSDTSADVELSFLRSTDSATVRLRSSTQITPEFVTSPSPTADATAQVEVVLRSPTPVEYEIEVVFDALGQTACASTHAGDVSIPGFPTFDIDRYQQSSSAPIRLTVGPAGRRIRLAAKAFASQSQHGVGCVPGLLVGVGFHVHAIGPATTYGSPCGTELLTNGVLDDPTQSSITIDRPAGATFNLISIASGQGFFMMSFGCPCLVSPILASIALPVDVDGDSTLTFTNPPPGFFTMQALTADAGGGYHLSNGLQF